MTPNQLAYLRYEEDQRANMANEMLKSEQLDLERLNVTENLKSMNALRAAQAENTRAATERMNTQNTADLINALNRSGIVGNDSLSLELLSTLLADTNPELSNALNMAGVATQIDDTTDAVSNNAHKLYNATHDIVQLAWQPLRTGNRALELVNRYEDQIIDALNPIGEVVSTLLGSDVSAKSIIDALL
jgi:phosphoribosylformylglycinamidine (FGAM) synthase-like enzyme